MLSLSFALHAMQLLQRDAVIMLSICDTGHVVAPEAEFQSLDCKMILLIQLAGQLQVEGGLARRALHAHLGNRLRPHVWCVEHIPHQTALRMLPAARQPA